MSTIDNIFFYKGLPTDEQLNDLFGDDEILDSLAYLGWSLPSVPTHPIPGSDQEPLPMTTTTQSTSAAIAARSPFPAPPQETPPMPVSSSVSGSSFQSSLFKELMPQQLPEHIPAPSLPISFEFQSPLFRELSQQQIQPHLAYRAEGKESAIRPSTPLLLMGSLDSRFPSKMPTRQILSESEYDLMHTFFESREKTFKPRSGLEHPLHQEINKHVNALIRSPKVLKLDEEAKATCEQLISEICQVSIEPIPQELIEVAVRFHMFKAFVNNLGSCNEKQKTILFSIATGNGLFSLPQLDPSERPLTVLGQVIATSDKLITKGLNTVVTAAQTSKSAISQLVKQTSSSIKDTFSIQRQPIDFSSVTLAQSTPSPIREAHPISLASSIPPSTMPTPQPVQESLYPSFDDFDSSDSTGSDWVPVSQPTSSTFNPIGPQAPTVTAQIVVHYAGNEGDKLTIRGTAPAMKNWAEGIEMRREGNMWIYDSTDLFDTFEFKLMLNNRLWEEGDNHSISMGNRFEIPTVHFHHFT